MYTFNYLCSKMELPALIEVSGFSNFSLQKLPLNFVGNSFKYVNRSISTLNLRVHIERFLDSTHTIK